MGLGYFLKIKRFDGIRGMDSVIILARAKTTGFIVLACLPCDNQYRKSPFPPVHNRLKTNYRHVPGCLSFFLTLKKLL